MGGRLHKPVETLTIPAAADHLSNAFGQEVAEAEIIRWGVDGQMTLSVEFKSYALGRTGKTVRPGQAKRRSRHSLGALDRAYPPEHRVSEDEILVLDVPFETVGISGVWDLTMLGPERRDIEYRYMLTDSRRFTRNHLHDTFVKRPNGTWCQLWQRRT